LFVGDEVTSIYRELIQTALCHSSLRRIIFNKNHRNPQFYAWRKDSSLKLAFAAVQLVYVSSNSSSLEVDFHRNIFNREISLSLTPQYHIRHLDLNFKSWKLHWLLELLSALPSLVTLKIRGFFCYNCVFGWLDIDKWAQILQNLKALHRVDIVIQICLALPFRLRRKIANRFNRLAAQKIETCKRINLTAGRRIKRPNAGGIGISASLNMNIK
jgi:hypothetical protein